MASAYLLVSYGLAAVSAVASPHLSLQAPVGVTSALEAAESPLAFVVECLDLHSKLGLDNEYLSRSRRHQSLTSEVDGIWGLPDSMPTSVGRHYSRSCKRPAIITILNDLDIKLDDVTAKLAVAEIPLRRGAWVGPIALCRDSVLNTDFGFEKSSGQIALTIRLTDDAKSLIARITEARVNRSMAIRVDGRVVSSPAINEPITGGVLDITGPDRTDLERIRSAAASSC